MTDLNEAREQINACDAVIVEALVRRMDCVREVAAYKKAHQMPVFQPQREAEQKEALKNKLAGSGLEPYLGAIFEEILRNSRRMQADILFQGNIFLIGFMGSGKSTIADRLCADYGLEAVEMDAQIEQQQKMSIPEIFARYGEAYFRKLETEFLMEFGNRKQCVVSCGGGAAMREENVSQMKKHGTVVLLRACPETVYERVKDSTNRPLLNSDMSISHISELMEARRPKYEAAADIVIETDGKTVSEICGEIMASLM